MILEALRAKARQSPERRAFTFLLNGEAEGDSLTYAQLDCRARAISGLLRGHGAVGERALLLFPPGLEFITAFLGCLYAGVTAVPAYPPKLSRAQQSLRSIVRDTQPKAVLTSGALMARVDSLISRVPELQAVQWLATDAIGDEPAGVWEEPDIRSDTLAFLQYTSGSTSAPKGVEVTHGNLLHNEEMIRLAFEQTEDSVVVSWLPLYHDMGLIGGVLQPLFVGAQCVLMSPQAFLQRPMRWLEAISNYRATTSGGPNFAYDLCVRRSSSERRIKLDLSSWKVAFNGAEPVRAESLARFAQAFAGDGFRPTAFFPCYGLAEATLFVAGGSPDTAPKVRAFDAAALEENRVVEPLAGEVGQELVSSGYPRLGQQILIVDPDTRQRVAANEVGEIWVSGPSVARGYFRQTRTERAGPPCPPRPEPGCRPLPPHR